MDQSQWMLIEKTPECTKNPVITLRTFPEVLKFKGNTLEVKVVNSWQTSVLKTKQCRSANKDSFV